MISDVLFEAIKEIERYQREMPHVYDQYKTEIAHVKVEMSMLLAKLDAFPTEEGNQEDAEVR